MHSTHISPIPRPIVKQDNAGARLNWLLRANAAEAKRARLFRFAGEEEQMQLMRQPVSTEKAYALLGLLLGSLPPASIFARLFGYGIGGGGLHINRGSGAIFFLCLMMNVICGVVGYAMGIGMSRAALRFERQSWTKMLMMMPLVGAGWGATAGLAGGFIFFGIGALFGAASAIPIGAAAFLVFAIFHHLLE
ncbi:MAG: hypothetical protein JOZ52_14165, partial [Acidobacteria bacterium]|nr:hypothetical protein [Acidobacteriota bacterium]